MEYILAVYENKKLFRNFGVSTSSRILKGFAGEIFLSIPKFLACFGYLIFFYFFKLRMSTRLSPKLFLTTLIYSLDGVRIITQRNLIFMTTNRLC